MSSIVKALKGIAFGLILQRAFGAGLTFLLAMLVKLVPQKLGDSVVLTQAGLNHFWESLLTFLVVMPIFLGKPFTINELSSSKNLGTIFALVFEEELNEHSYIGNFFFASLSGLFLYISLTSFFPVLQTLIDQAGKTQKHLRVNNLGANFA